MTLTQIKPLGLSKPIDLADNEKIRLGTGDDLKIYHDGTISRVQDDTNHLYVKGVNITLFKGNTAEKFIDCISDGAVELYHDNAKMLETTSTGAKISNGNRVLTIKQGSNSNYVNLAAESTAGSDAYLDINSYGLQLKTDGTTRFQINNDGNIDIPDSTKLRFGTGDDLEIYHNGSNSVIADVGTGNLSLQTNGTDINFWNGSEFLAKFVSNGSVELYDNGSKKFETTSGGAEVQGYFTAGKPTDYWSTTSSYINVANYGGLGTAGSYEITLTAGGYRKGSGQWEDYTVNSQSGYASQIALNPTNGNIIFRTQSGKSTGDSHAVSERMRINSSGHALFGTTTDTLYDDNSGNGVVIRSAHGAVDIKRDNDLPLNLNRVGGDGGLIRMIRDGTTKADIGIKSSHLTFDVNGSERMRIQSNGKILINRTNEDGSGQINLALNASGHGISTRTASNSTQTHLDFGNQNGIVGSVQTNGSSTSFNTSSDYRLKENATAISDGITRLKTLKPYRFNWKADSSTKVDGFFAHEVSSAIPEAISGTKDETEDILYTAEDTIPSGKKVGDVKETVPKYQGIDQSKLVPLLVAALQETIGRIEKLETA